MHHLIIGALQEGRIDRGERLEAFRRQARGEGDAVLLGDADIEAARREIRCANRSSPVPDGMAAVMATIRSSLRASWIRLCGEDLGVARRIRLRRRPARR